MADSPELKIYVVLANTNYFSGLSCWSPVEKRRLIKAVRCHGPDTDKLAKAIGTNKGPIQISDILKRQPDVKRAYDRALNWFYQGPP